MGQLLLYDAQGVQLGSRPMDAAERTFYYQAWWDGEPITHAGQQYRLVTVAWLREEEDLRCLVECGGPVPVDYVDD